MRWAAGQSSQCAEWPHLLPKNDMILPWPGLPPFFATGLLPAFAAAGGNVLAFFGAGSSSENDSHAASSVVTVQC